MVNSNNSPPKRDGGQSSNIGAQGAAYLALKNLAGGAANFVLFVFVAKFLAQVADLGAIQGLQLLILLFSLVAGFGLTTAMTRFSSFYIGANQKEVAYRIYPMVFLLGIIFSIAVSIFVFFYADILADLFFHSVSYTTSMKLSAVIILFYSLITYCNAVFYSMHEFKKVSILVTLDWVLRVALAVLITAILPSIESVLVGFIIGDICILIISIILLRTFIFRQVRFDHLFSLMRYSLPLFPSIIFTSLSMNVDYYMILILSGVYTAGLYTPAIIIGSMLQLIGSGLAETLLPIFSRMYGRGGSPALTTSSFAYTRYLFLYFLPIGFISLALSPSIILLLLGDVFLESLYPAIIIITTITLTSVGINVFNYILLSAGYTKIFLYSTSISLFVQIMLAYLLIPVYDTTGAAISKSMAFVIMFAYPAIMLKRIKGLNYDSIALKHGVIGSVIVSTPLLILNYLIGSIYLIPLTILVGFVSYLLFLRLTSAVERKDIELVVNAFPITRSLMRIVSKIVIR